MKDEIFSIVVTTYNQQDTLIETLESIRLQTYKPIELIISDDCSTDETLNIADKWLAKNKERFVNTKIVKTPVNSGISANVSNGLKTANGEFLKYMAGDDLLLPDAIESMSDFLNDNQNARFCISKVRNLYTYKSEYFYGLISPTKNVEKRFLSCRTTDEQFKILAFTVVSPAVGSFFRRNVFEEKGYPDEDIKCTDDEAIWLKLNRRGEFLFYLPKLTSYWRRHFKSTSVIQSKTMSGESIHCHLQIKYRYVVPNLYLLSLKELFDMLSNIIYLQNMIKNGEGHTAHRKSKWIRLISPAFYFDRPRIIKIKIINFIRRMKYGSDISNLLRSDPTLIITKKEKIEYYKH